MGRYRTSMWYICFVLTLILMTQVFELLLEAK